MARYDKTKKSGEPDTFIRTMLERASDAFDGLNVLNLKAKAIDDYRFTFIPGNQWDRHLKTKRGTRPCYEFPRQRQMVLRITGQMRQNQPQIKVRPVEDADMDTAEIFNGLIRNIEASSHAEIAYDAANDWAVAGGLGYLRVKTEYEGSDVFYDGGVSQGAFNQCLKIVPVFDPYTIAFDPTARGFFREDAKYCFVSELISREEFKRRYPKAQVVDFNAPDNQGTQRDWWYEKSVRIAEYWKIEHEKKVIYRLSDGRIVDQAEFDPIADEWAEQGLTIEDRREVACPKVKMCIVSGKDRLTEEYDWPGRYIPIIPQWGNFHVVEGEQIYSGATRYGRDSQMLHNFELSTAIEVLAKQPNSPLMATPAMVEGLETYYERMGYDDPPVLLYNVDERAPQSRPQREPMAAFPAAMAQMSQITSEELKANMGIYDASLGARSNETSGRAIMARQQESNISNFHYSDNQAKASTWLGVILVDLIPKTYDSERSIRILGEDGAEKYVQLYQPMVDRQTGETRILNDLSAGRYDVVVSIGKAYETQRMEVAEAAQALAPDPGPMGLLAKYLLIKNIDVAGFDEFRKASRKILVAQGLLEPDEGDQPPPPQPPNPKDMASAQKDLSQAELNKARAAEILAKTPVELQQAQARAERTQFQAAEEMRGMANGITGPAAPGIEPQ